jgi:uncharacterized protein (DUF1697 family)
VATLITLLRGVNVGGNKMVPMAQLKSWLGQQGMTDVRTLLNSGNAIFRAPAPAGPKLERVLEAAAEREFKLKADIHVRTLAEWKQLIADNPFASEAKSDPGHLLALVLKAAPTAAQAAALQTALPGRERAVVHGRHAYRYYPDGVGQSRLTPALLDRVLGSRGTARNWNTVLKLAAAAAELTG